MADLEKLLLEAAGRTSGSGSGKKRHSSPPGSRRRRDSDDGSDSKDDQSDDNRGYLNRKSSGPQIPMKKRLDSSERDENQRSHDEGGGDGDDDDRYDRDSDESGDEIYGADLYKDEQDKEKLAKMTELQREMILSERADKIKDKKIREDMKSKTIVKKKKMKKTPLSSSGGLRSSTRSTATKTALIELKAKRLNKKQQDDPVTKQDEPGSKRRSNKSSASPSSSSEDDDGRMMIDNSDDEEEQDKKSKLPSYDDIKDITIRRSKLAKWFMEPFFDELIVGCFVRVGIVQSRTGPIYRLCLVRNIDASDSDRQYKFENKMTQKYLNLVWGNENSSARWQMTMISDSRPTREEFDQWVREVERYGSRMPNKQDIIEKKESIEKTNTFVYNADTVKQMLLEKKAATWKPLNVAAEKDRLRKEMEVAKSKNRVADVARIKLRIEELEESRKDHQEKDRKAIRLSEMNKKNRFENFKSASELKPVNTTLKAGEDGYDPFSRRWTKSVNYYLPVSAHDPPLPPLVHEQKEKEKDEKKEKEGLVDVRAPVGELMESNDKNNIRGLHNFDIVISLDKLKEFGGVQEALMARKQRIEATVGVKVPVDDGKRHLLTLSVSDYKRRRGLL